MSEAEDQIRVGIEALKAVSDLLVNVNGHNLDMVRSENLCGLMQVITGHIEGGVDALAERRATRRVGTA